MVNGYEGYLVVGTHKDLDVWKLSMDLVDAIYRLTREFPNEEKYGLSQQMRRSAISIPSNIAEGCGRNHKGELLQFIGIARGSLAELETQLIISSRQALAGEVNVSNANADIQSISKMLYRWQESIKNAN